MDRARTAVVWYRFRATLARRWAGYLAIVLITGVLGGLAMGAIAGARRTQSSYPTFLASTNPSTLNVAVYNPATDGGPGPPLTAKLAHLPGVTSVHTVAAPTIVPLTATGAPRLNTEGLVTTLSSSDGEFLDHDRITPSSGRLANPSRADEVTMTASAARLLGAHLGGLVPLGIYVPSELNLPGFGTAKVPPVVRVAARVVGIVTLNSQVVQDDIDRAYGFIFVSPALLRDAAARAPIEGDPEGYTLNIAPHGPSVATVEQDVVNVIPGQMIYEFHVTARVVSEVELAIKPESFALGGFGVIAGLVVLVLGIQAISRQLRLADEDRRVLRALGADPLAAAGDGLIGVAGAIVLGAVLAVAVAVALSPLAPLGPVRPLYPDRGVAFDWTVLGVGFAILVIGLGAAAVGLTYRYAPSHLAKMHDAPARASRIATAGDAAGVPVAGLIGARFALETSRGRDSVPVRSALLGTVVAVVLLVATLTFGSGLRTLVATPALYGWNWTYMLNPSNDVPPAVLPLLSRDRDVAAWTGIPTYTNVELAGITVPVLITDPHPAVAPPILSGHDVEGPNQIVLGAATLAELGKQVGDTVQLSVGSPRSAPLYIAPETMRIVGTATFPAVGFSSFVADHTSMGTGALITTGAMPKRFLEATSSKDPNQNGPDLVFVRMKPGVSPAAGRANLDRIAQAADRVFARDPQAGGNDVTVLGVQRPAQIVNYHSIGSTPVALAVGLAFGAIIALALTLLASVRHRRHDLALLKALGFTPRQLATVVVWQATVTALVGVIIGLPVGIIFGRELWTIFAENINAVPDPTVPVLSVALVGLGALVFANIVAAVPGRYAARTPTALVLRAE